MKINKDNITHEVFGSGFYVFRYYNESGLLIHKKQYIFYNLKEAKQLFLTELKTIFL
jgi:hypothetical protein